MIIGPHWGMFLGLWYSAALLAVLTHAEWKRGRSFCNENKVKTRVRWLLGFVGAPLSVLALLSFFEPPIAGAMYGRHWISRAWFLSVGIGLAMAGISNWNACRDSPETQKWRKWLRYVYLAACILTALIATFAAFPYRWPWETKRLERIAQQAAVAEAQSDVQEAQQRLYHTSVSLS